MFLRMKLLSDTAFGRGDGVPGMVDSEVEYDAGTGLPIVKGRTIKGLIVEACADLLYGLKQFNRPAHDHFAQAAQDLFGVPGSQLFTTGWLHFGTATLPVDLVQRVQQSGFSAPDVFEAFTAVRRQTAVDPLRDTPMDATLRATRVVLRDTVFHVPLSNEWALDDIHLALLAACASTVRHVGLNRTRGLGHVAVTLEGVGQVDHLNTFATITQEISR